MVKVTTLKDAYLDLLLNHIEDIATGAENLEDFFSSKSGYGLNISHDKLVEHMREMHKNKNRKVSVFSTSLMKQSTNGYFQYRTNIPSSIIRDQNLQRKDQVRCLITKDVQT
jgi:Zn-dependent peptidase ImmA (M78 family)